MENLREKLLKIVRKTLRDGYLSEELDELIDQIVEELEGRLDVKE
jgi:hypothetical protein